MKIVKSQKFSILGFTRYGENVLCGQLDLFQASTFWSVGFQINIYATVISRYFIFSGCREENWKSQNALEWQREYLWYLSSTISSPSHILCTPKKPKESDQSYIWTFWIFGALYMSQTLNVGYIDLRCGSRRHYDFDLPDIFVIIYYNVCNHHR